MKRILFALAMAVLAGGSVPRAHADTNVSIDFFYDNLGDDGSWVEVGDYGYCWQPNVAVSDSSWRPYADGYWAYTDVGWTWVSYENFGWATYHYGNWVRLRDHGWVWIPGTEWGPAWVSWRTGGDYVGWAPLPPRGEGAEPIYEGRPITGRVDVEFDIGPEYYNFVDVRYIGEPVLRRRILNPRENITYISTTVNVTNITYSNSVVYNYGPDYHRLSAYSTREIPRLHLQRETNVDLRAAARSNALTKVQGNQLLIAAPLKVERPAQSAVPKVVKTKFEKPKVERGWSGVNDPKKRAELEAKFKNEDARSIPAPKIEAAHPEDLKKVGEAPTPNASPAVSAAPVESATPVRNTPEVMKQKDDLTMRTPTPEPTTTPNESKSKGRDRRGASGQPSPAASMAPGAEDTTTPAITPNERNKGREKRGSTGRPMPEATAAPAAEGTATPNEKKGSDRRKIAPIMQTPPPSTSTTESANETTKTPRNPRPERKTYVPNPPDGSGPRTTNKLQSVPTDVANPDAGAAQPNGGKIKPQRPQPLPPQNRNNQLVPPNNATGSGQSEGQGGGKANKNEKGKRQKPNEEAASPAPNL